MALDPVTNFAKVTVSTGYDDTATSIVLSSGHGAKLPDPATAGAFNLVWWNSTDYSNPTTDPNVEIVRCTARSTDTLTVTRAQESTTATVKNTGGKTYLMALAITKKMIDDIGKLVVSTVPKSSAYTILDTDGYTCIFISGTDTVIKLPVASIIRLIKFCKTDAGTVSTIQKSDTGSDTIEGATTLALNSQYDTVSLISDGTATWYRF